MNNPNTQPATQAAPTTPAPPSQRRLHPLVATAAGAVLVASLVATAAVTGMFPKASSTGERSNQTQAAQVVPQTSQQPVVDSAAPANLAAQQSSQQYSQQAAQPAAQQTAQPAEPEPQPQRAPAAAPAQQYAQQQYAPQQPAQPAPQYAQQQPVQAAHCSTCGTVVGISAVRQEGHGTGIGAVGGAVAGGVVGNQFGSGNGRTAMTLLGALGGGLAGNSVEKHLRSTTSYSVRVRMENGKTRYFTYHEAPPFQQGQRVRVQNGSLVAD
ncbi:outer membrane lipoprotein SlyB [Paraburkholderia phenoliruptrix]|uniref:glycine zipper 2TM domain-containing protein n=1 Tax=Paraburkholderia phenoliruptrix TaxID=252970 RepID=UPI00286061F0|nr:glycine zipper 2TM domain-containing protein [Paraburkholderia phenoliruptrix]MDR6419413.1 outer membrane lipoprotein SlyB [Paraburkholderia phenoliruptrix]